LVQIQVQELYSVSIREAHHAIFLKFLVFIET